MPISACGSFILTLFVWGVMGMNMPMQAQRLVLGFRLMPVIPSMQLESEAGYAVRGRASSGFAASGFLGYQLNSPLGLQAEIHLSSFSLRYEEQGVTRRVGLQYVQIPLLLAVNTGRHRLLNLNVVAGPQVGINTGASVRVSGAGINTPVAILDVRKADIGVAYGAGLDVGVNRRRALRFGTGYRSVAGLFSIGRSGQAVAPGTFLVADNTRVRTHGIYLETAWVF